jgi:uncharacterized protein YdhG (YjbR/CyaY superfamily)
MAVDKKNVANNVDEYIAQFPANVKTTLEKLRKGIKTAAPNAEEVISYMMPAYKYHGMLVYFAGYKNHIGFYPGAAGIAAFKDKIAVYKNAKGSVQFPIDQPLPLGLITEIVQFRVKQNEEKSAKKNPTKPTVKKSSAPKPSDKELVNTWLAKLPVSSKAEIEAVRKIIQSANTCLCERIKWNAPSYYYKEDIVTFGPYKTQKILLVFHHPAVVKIKSALLEGDYKDRRLVYFKDKAEATKNKKELARIINEIIKAIDKK